MSSTTARPPSVLLPGLLIGVGLGGFVDGIVLHQVLQWHHLLSASATDRAGVPTHPVDTVPGLEANTLADGLFHVVAWVSVVTGLVLLWRRVTAGPGPWSRRSLLGLALAGFGLFNLVEGLVNHHLLGLHHVREATQVDHVLAWDLSFLASGVLLLVGGLVLHRSGQERLAAGGSEPYPGGYVGRHDRTRAR